MPIPNQGLKRCGKCGKRKPASEFYRKSASRQHWAGGLASECKTCSRGRTRARYKKKREEILAKDRVTTNARRARIKDAVFAAYGGYVCACCGETGKLFLTIDHMNNDGAAFRRRIGGKRTAAGYHTYIWLLKHNFPEGHQVLCMNCQQGKRMNNGVCPHQARSNDYPVKGVGASASKIIVPMKVVWSRAKI